MRLSCILIKHAVGINQEIGCLVFAVFPPYVDILVLYRMIRRSTFFFPFFVPSIWTFFFSALNNRWV